MENDIAEALHKSLKKKGVDIKTGIKLEKFEETRNGIKLMLEGGESLEVEKALLSIGRKADLSCVEGLGLKTERGRIVADERMQTSLDGVLCSRRCETAEGC